MARKKNAPAIKSNLRDVPADKFRAINRMDGIVTMVEYSSEDDIKAYELEPTFRELGGGGSGDFSTAQITFTSSLEVWGLAAAIPIILNEDEFLGSCSYADVVVGSDMAEHNTMTAILYKNACKFFINPEEGFTITTSGNASYDGRIVTVTGDCTITVISDTQ